VFFDVMMRNLFNRPFIWGTDVTELSMGLMAFGAFPLLALRLGHINIELLPIKADSSLGRGISVLISLLTAVVFLGIAWQFQVFADRTGRTSEIMAQLGLRWTVIWWVLLVFALLTVACALYVVIKQTVLLVRRNPE
jgi:TRAP-type C4-dicarboxylate transport system permease small subunit